MFPKFIGVLLGLCLGAAVASPASVVRIGKYEVELRVPDEGLFAGEAVDVEFRLSDHTQADPIEGNKGIPNAAPTALVTMPAMEGMPPVRPKIHSEGVPGDYGLELFFPHGGDYRIGLTLNPPGDKPFKAAFTVSVKDAEARKGRVVAKPFTLSVGALKDRPIAGKPIPLSLAVKDTRTGATVTRFDVAHTKVFHLVIVSRDLKWFVHEHPTQMPDGSFRIDTTFPAGGDYLLFGDVAPKDKGSQVLPASLHVDGPVPAATPLRVTSGPSRAGGLVATMTPLASPIPIGQSTTLAFRLRDAKTGQPVSDLQPYLGAHGHLMIIHQDGKTFVHSHPAEDAAAIRLLKSGEVRFNARFPRAGIYKAWAQFQRAGQVVTLPFVFEVKP